MDTKRENPMAGARVAVMAIAAAFALALAVMPPAGCVRDTSKGSPATEASEGPAEPEPSTADDESSVEAEGMSPQEEHGPEPSASEPEPEPSGELSVEADPADAAPATTSADEGVGIAWQQPSAAPVRSSATARESADLSQLAIPQDLPPELERADVERAVRQWLSRHGVQGVATSSVGPLSFDVQPFEGGSVEVSSWPYVVVSSQGGTYEFDLVYYKGMYGLVAQDKPADADAEGEVVEEVVEQTVEQTTVSEG